MSVSPDECSGGKPRMCSEKDPGTAASVVGDPSYVSGFDKLPRLQRT